MQDCDSDQVQISYWSYGSSRSRGVAILLTPQAVLHAAAWNEDRWKTRAIGISMHDMYILNEYAPNDWPERESLFDSLHDWNLPSGTSVLLGDFNSVQVLIWTEWGHELPVGLRAQHWADFSPATG